MTHDNYKAGLAGLALLAALGLICPLLAAHSIPLTDPIEGLHASIAQEMVEHGDWIVPRQLQEPFLDKPILYFWAIAASLKLFGMSEAAVRLPGLLFGLLGTLTTALIGHRLLGRCTGLLAGIFYAAMVLPSALVQQPAHDAALVPMVNLALLCFWESDGAGTATVRLGLDRSGRHVSRLGGFDQRVGGRGTDGRRLRRIPASGATTTSGPLLPRHTGAVYCGGDWGLVVRRRGTGKSRFPAILLFRAARARLLHGLAATWQCAVVVLSAHPCRRRDSVDMVFTSAAAGRIGPKGRKGKRDKGRRGERQSLLFSRAPFLPASANRRPMLLVCCWFIGCTLLLSASHSKLVTYLWPVFPAVAILAAEVWTRKIEGLLCGAAERVMSAVVWCTCLVGPAALPVTLAITQIAMPTRFSPLVWTIAVAVALTTWAPLWAWFLGKTRLTIGLAAATMCGQLAVLLWFALPQVAVGLSARDLARHYNRTRAVPSRMMLAQERVGSVLFYLDRDLRDRLLPGQIANQEISDRLPSPRIGADEWIAIPDRHLQWCRNDYDLDHARYEKIEGFRLYRRTDLKPWALKDHGDDSQALMGCGDCPLLR